MNEQNCNNGIETGKGMKLLLRKFARVTSYFVIISNRNPLNDRENLHAESQS